MGQRPNELTPHESLQHYWGAELRALRVAQGLSLAELGRQLHCDPSYLAKIERAERSIPTRLAESCDQILATHGALIRLHALAEAAASHTAVTGDQSSLHVACDEVHVAGQASSLASEASFPAALDTGAEIVVPARTADGRVVFVSVPRRVVLQGLGSAAAGLTAAPVTLSAATASFPAVGDVNPLEHFQQLRQVLIDNDNLFGPRHVIPVVREQIAIMQQLRSSSRGVDGRELHRVQAQYSEFCAGLYYDSGEHHLAESWNDRALALSHLAADHDLTVYILTGQARLAGGMRVSADAIGAGEQAGRMAPPRSRLAVIAASHAAYGYALSGDQAATQRTHDRARELLGTLDDDPASPYGPWLNENWLALGEAQSWMVLGDYHGAAQIFQDAIADFPSRYRRTRGVFLARTALAQACDHEVEHAATLGLEALPIGVQTDSARTLTTLAQLNDRLAPWNTVPAVADFRTAMKDTILPQA
jgi:tetratricopeptide (TPR) repeat protein